MEELFGPDPTGTRLAGVPRFEITHVDLFAIDDSSLIRLATIAAFPAVALLFLKHVGHPALSLSIPSWTPALRAAVAAPPAGRVLALLITYLFEAARDRRAKDALVDAVPEGLEMYRTAADELIEKGIEKGIGQGIEKGIEKGIEQGRVEGGRRSIRRILEARFGSAPEHAFTRIDQIEDQDRIDALVALAATAPDLAGFERALGA